MDLHICNFLKVFWWVVQVKLDIPRAFKPLNAWKQIFKMCGFTRPIFHCKASSKLGRSGGLGVKAVTPTPPKKTSQVLDLRLPLLYNVKELNHQAFILWLLSSKSNIGLSLWHLAVTHYNIIVLRSRTFSVMSCAESWHLFHVRRKRADKPIFYVFLSHFFLSDSVSLQHPLSSLFPAPSQFLSPFLSHGDMIIHSLVFLVVIFIYLIICFTS